MPGEARDSVPLFIWHLVSSWTLESFKDNLVVILEIPCCILFFLKCHSEVCEREGCGTPDVDIQSVRSESGKEASGF